ncbi:hypothetical protein L1987_37131 [Smallanthus sonchifolius]|uniref:Uncharacterized protein n=1 Tax=Smallanthus sonchifolius TaxID=185202 RepID=A0ACB9HF40_9ASTR|nr:hypothetical protein L1987_37131 [Smallanthus sonchifolius]
MENDVVPKTFKTLVKKSDRKFAKVRDLPAYGRIPNHYFANVFKAYMKLWKYQQQNRVKLMESGLQRWEIGEIASRIGQLYFLQYMRTSEARFLLESCIFYEAILNRSYFDGLHRNGLNNRVLRFKELRFYARFLQVSLILNRWEMVQFLLDRFKALVDDSNAKFGETNFKEWNIIMQEMARFMKVDAAITKMSPLRYCLMFDSYPNSLQYVARFHANKVLKLRDTLLMSYHRNEVNFGELTIDTFRMLQCLEWEPSQDFYQKPVESFGKAGLTNQSCSSGLIDINLVADMMDPSLPPNPKKAVLYRPSVTQLVSVMATMCDELPPDSVMLIYIAASGSSGQTSVQQRQKYQSARTSNVRERNHLIPQTSFNEKETSSHPYESSLWLGPSRTVGSNDLYPGDLTPFTRKPAFFIIDSNNSHAFKGLHGAERGEPAALFLSPSRPTFKDQLGDATQNGSQFTLFLTAPLLACCQMLGLTFSDEVDAMEDAESIVSTAFSEWEVILCTSTTLDLVWAQVLSEPLLRRLILRFIFCRSLLTLYHHQEGNDLDLYVPVSLPQLPDSVSSHSRVVQSAIMALTDHLKISHCFRFDKL